MSEREQLEQAIAHLEAQRATLGDAVVETALGPLRQQLAELEEAPAVPSAVLTGERKLVTILFTDISGFTAMAETMDPEVVRDLMNNCFERLVPIIERYGGTLDKFTGDGIMALFGAPVTHENDAERALRATLDMQEALAQFNTERGIDLDLHFGINTGLVIAGSIGTRERQSYSVMGDAVNVAARLEEAAQRDEILVGPDTHRLVKALFEFEALPPISIKGRAEPVPIYRLLTAKAVPGKTRGLAGLASPLVGRQAEFEALLAAVERLPSGQGGIVTLVGEAGLGKSRLVAETRATEPARQGTSWVEGRCLSYGTAIAYLLWVNILRNLLGVTPEDPPTTVQEALQKKLQALCPEHAGELYPYLGQILSLPLDTAAEELLHHLESEQIKKGAFRAIETLLAHTAQVRPLVVVCEDMHWADPTSIELLEQLLPLTQHLPLLLLCVFRPERDHGCLHIREVATHLQPAHVDLWLTPLNAAESAALVGNLLQVEALPIELRRRILGRAEGNPFYVEEILRSLMDNQDIVYDRSTDRWVATGDVSTIVIPDTLHGVLTARIDRLQEETKRVLQLAAVIGRIFLYRILAAIAQEERHLEEQLGRHLRILQREEMIRERARMPELEYIFKHQLTQEAAYNGLLKKDRRSFHRQVAKALERLFPDRVEEQLGLLAYHWERAEEPEKATTYLLRAGDRARLAYAHQEAIDTYRRALVFLKQQPDHERTARTLMKLGLTHHAAFDFRRAHQAYEEGFSLWQQAGEGQQATALPPAPHPLRTTFTSPPTLDPTLAGDNSSTTMIKQLFSGLAEQTPEMEVIPDGAQSWEVSEGGRKCTFHLRADVRWSDGRPVTANDYVYAWKRVLDPAIDSPMATILYDVVGARAFHQGRGSREQVAVRALDEQTLAVELEQPTGYFLHLLTLTPTYPIPRHVVEAHGETWAAPETITTNGPFQLEDWQAGQSGVLVRNPQYHGHFRGNLQWVELTFGLDPDSVLNQYEADELDIVWSLWSFPLTTWTRFLQPYADEYVSLPELATHHVRFNIDRPPFDDVRVRQAFVLGTDRETLADEVTSGYAFPATGGFVPPGIPGHSPGIALPYDPNRASQCLAAAGYPQGRGFPVIEALAPRGRDVWCAYLQQQWQDNLGVQVLWETQDWSTFIQRIRQDLPSIIINGWVADYPDPDNFLRVWLAYHQIAWRNEHYRELVETARVTLNQEDRMALYRQADQILIEEALLMPLIYRRWHMMVKSWVKRLPTWIVQWKDVIIEPHGG